MMRHNKALYFEVSEPTHRDPPLTRTEGATDHSSAKAASKESEERMFEEIRNKNKEVFDWEPPNEVRSMTKAEIKLKWCSVFRELALLLRRISYLNISLFDLKALRLFPKEPNRQPAFQSFILNVKAGDEKKVREALFRDRYLVYYYDSVGQADADGDDCATLGLQKEPH